MEAPRSSESLRGVGPFGALGANALTSSRPRLVEPEGSTTAGPGIRAGRAAPPSRPPVTARPPYSEPTLEETAGPLPPRRCTTCAEAFGALDAGGLTLDELLDCFWSAASASRDPQGRPLTHGLDRNARDREALRDEFLVRCSQHLSLHPSLTSSRGGPLFQEAGPPEQRPPPAALAPEGTAPPPAGPTRPLHGTLPPAGAPCLDCASALRATAQVGDGEALACFEAMLWGVTGRLRTDDRGPADAWGRVLAERIRSWRDQPERWPALRRQIERWCRCRIETEATLRALLDATRLPFAARTVAHQEHAPAGELFRLAAMPLRRPPRVVEEKKTEEFCRVEEESRGIFGGLLSAVKGIAEGAVAGMATAMGALGIRVGGGDIKTEKQLLGEIEATVEVVGSPAFGDLGWTDQLAIRTRLAYLAARSKSFGDLVVELGEGVVLSLWDLLSLLCRVVRGDAAAAGELAGILGARGVARGLRRYAGGKGGRGKRHEAPEGSPDTGPRVGVGDEGMPRERNAGGPLEPEGSGGRGNRSGKRSGVAPGSRRTPHDCTPDEAANRVDELKAQGHGPQRHEGKVESAQHDARVLRGTDPATSSPEVHLSGKKAGQPKKPPDSSSSFRSNEAYAQAELKARGGKEFLKQMRSGKDWVEVKGLSLRDALGDDYLRHVEGRTTVGLSGASTRAVDFANGTVTAVYRRTPGGEYGLYTMYPEGR